MATDLIELIEADAQKNKEGNDALLSASKKPTAEQGDGKLSNKQIYIAVAGAIVFLTLGIILGTVLFGGGGSAGDSVDRGEVTAVREKVPAYDSLKSMRENTISGLRKQLAEYGNTAKGNNYTLTGELVAISKANDHIVKSLGPVLDKMVISEVTCDDMQQYMENTEVFKDDEEKSASLKILAEEMGTYLPTGTDVSARFEGGSPRDDLGKDCSVVSAPTASLLAVTSNESSSIGGHAYLVTVPVADDAGGLHVAAYTFAVDANGKVLYCAYSGLIESDQEISLADAYFGATSAIGGAQVAEE